MTITCSKLLSNYGTENLVLLFQQGQQLEEEDHTLARAYPSSVLLSISCPWQGESLSASGSKPPPIRAVDVARRHDSAPRIALYPDEVAVAPGRPLAGRDA